MFDFIEGFAGPCRCYSILAYLSLPEYEGRHQDPTVASW